MTNIKRLDSAYLSEKLGISKISNSFYLKKTTQDLSIKMGPHRLEMYNIALITNGFAELQVGLYSYKVNSPGLVMLSPDDIRYWSSISEPIKMEGLFFSESFLISGLTDILFVKRSPTFQGNAQHFIPITGTQFLAFQSLFKLVNEKYTSTDPSKSESLQALIRFIIIELNNLQLNEMKVPFFNSTLGHQMTENFKILVMEHFRTERSVKFYADRLFITPKHLSQTVKNNTGKNANAWIDEIVGLESKAMINSTNLSISQISEALNFPNPSFFGKFFKRLTGKSPAKYRNEYKNDI
ncbi:helix-turn-helix domain-containing protein [Flavobacterium akiainvivens]|uniref:helix-turn-helix domain-containing protein n=1 Tax=Flavobacterium akiainvivens TaxID=1202724 RepID=UPI0006C87885|nr:helix-turn-helix domain-containing protein [Flavobacterium akiainvivens]SFQ77453.1 transcriptional regulator, AraC family [Flavobacterium akiainvivens]